MVLPPQLIRNILSGRCFALVGSGPSCEVGYPTWERLARLVSADIAATGRAKDVAAHMDLIANRNFPEFFRVAELDLGGKRQLLACTKRRLTPSHNPRGYIYEYLLKWPFACYLTTNFDSELVFRLRRNGQYFRELQNRVEDFAVMRDGVTDVVLKLHSDLDHTEDVVLTSRDYDRVSIASGYFRIKLRQLMEMFNILIIGHSLTDFDLDLIMREAKQTAAAHNPVYMIAPDISSHTRREYLERYNIVLISYPNADGSHAGLRRLLVSADRLIPARGVFIAVKPVDSLTASQATAATSLLIFRRLQIIRSHTSANSTEYLGPIVLQSLANASGKTPEQMLSEGPLAIIGANGTKNVAEIQATLHDLRAQGLVAGSTTYSLTPAGQQHVQNVLASRALEADQALGRFILTLRASCPTLSQGEEDIARTAMESAIVQAFKARGLALANAIFRDSSIPSEDVVDIFERLTHASVSLIRSEVRAAFVDAALDFFTTPTVPQKKYLASLAQGFFLYHMVGLDPSCAKIRRDIFARTAWFCDSSILLPLVAVGAWNHEYARDLFTKVLGAGGRVFVTQRMLKEAWEHMEWAIRFVERNGMITPSFVAAALGLPGYKQNLFIDGFINLSAEGRVSSFEDYLGLISSKKLTYATFAERLSNSGVLFTSMQTLDGYSSLDLEEVPPVREMIRADRLARDIFRSELQIEAEAEVFQIIKNLRMRRYRFTTDVERVYFVSQSNVLNRIDKGHDIVTWSPEAVYRYVSSLPGESSAADLLHECMLSEYFQAGISLIDKQRYQQFFGSVIASSKLEYEQQKAAYIRDTEATTEKALDEKFESIPDLQKPLFVSQMTFHNASVAQAAAEAANRKVAALSEQVRKLESEQERGWRKRDRKTIEQAEAEARNLQDPRRRRKKERKARNKARKKRKQHRS